MQYVQAGPPLHGAKQIHPQRARYRTPRETTGTTVRSPRRLGHVPANPAENDGPPTRTKLPATQEPIVQPDRKRRRVRREQQLHRKLVQDNRTVTDQERRRRARGDAAQAVSELRQVRQRQGHAVAVRNPLAEHGRRVQADCGGETHLLPAQPALDGCPGDLQVLREQDRAHLVQNDAQVEQEEVGVLRRQRRDVRLTRALQDDAECLLKLFYPVCLTMYYIAVFVID